MTPAGAEAVASKAVASKRQSTVIARNRRARHDYHLEDTVEGGLVLTGTSQADESLLTGESLPVEKRPGDTVTGGAINGAGLLRVQTTAVGTDSTLARIIALVEGAQSHKAPVQRLVDHVAAVFVPIVLACAVVGLGRDLGFLLALGVSLAVQGVVWLGLASRASRGSARPGPRPARRSA